jgi:nitrogen fixation protein FixH
MIRRRRNDLLRPSAGIALLIAALLSLSGCGGSSGTTPVKTIAQRQAVDQLIIALEVPERPQLLAEQEVLVTLTDPNGRPVEGGQVWLALIMPTMQMSPNEPDATAEGHGRYRAKVLFTMSGTWQLEVHATVQGQEHIATFHASTL